MFKETPCDCILVMLCPGVPLLKGILSTIKAQLELYGM